jgi:hypothetical protein
MPLNDDQKNELREFLKDQLNNHPQLKLLNDKSKQKVLDHLVESFNALGMTKQELEKKQDLKTVLEFSAYLILTNPNADPKKIQKYINQFSQIALKPENKHVDTKNLNKLVDDVKTLESPNPLIVRMQPAGKKLGIPDDKMELSPSASIEAKEEFQAKLATKGVAITAERPDSHTPGEPEQHEHSRDTPAHGAPRLTPPKPWETK